MELINKDWKVGEPLEYELQGIVYKTPPVPKLSTIRNSKKKPKDQIWERDLSYLQWDWNTDPSKGRLWVDTASPEQRAWFDAELERILVGSWIMINGQPTFFNADCYFFHQNFVLQENIYPTYKDTSLEYFYFSEDCEKDPVFVGEVGIKGRRVGLSSMSASKKLRILLTEDNTLQGIVSKTGVDAQEMFFFVKNAMENLLPFLMPDLNKVTESEIHVAKPSKKITAKNTKASADKGKNNRLDWRDTSENAYDQSRQRHVTLDEAGKWAKVSVLICLSKITETLVVGASVVGFISIFSTVNKGDKGGDNFRVIWDGSDHVNGKKDMFGRTRTKLKRFFLAGYRGLLGYVGKYGESIVDTPTPEQTEFLKTYIDPSTGKLACPNPYIGAKEYLMETRKMLANEPELLAEEIRKYPFEWKEVFKGANNKCNFDLDDLNEQIKRVEDELLREGKRENGRRGKFNVRSNGEKYFEDSPSGMWYILEFPERTNKTVIKGSIKCPDNGAFGCAGLDPFANAKHAIEKGSDACLMIHKRYDALDPDGSGYPCAMFLGRPSIKEEFHEQIYWGLEYFGIRMLAERTPTDWEDYAIKNKLASPLDTPGKLQGYLITRKRYNNSEIYGIPPQDKEAREQHLTEMIEYAKFNMRKIRFIRLLRDMLEFDIEERTDYDACMAWGYALMGLKEYQAIQKSEIKVREFMRLKKSKQYH